MAVTPLVHTGNVQTIRKILTWTAPALAIPALRYTQDNHQQRKELFVRDASTYSIGALTFLATEFICKKTLNHFNLIQNLGQRDLTAFIIALTANLLYAGIGAVQFSKAFSRYQADKAAQKSPEQKSVIQTQPSSQLVHTTPSPVWSPFFQPPIPLESMQRMQYFA